MSEASENIIEELQREIAPWQYQPVNDRFLSEDLLAALDACGRFHIDKIADCLQCAKSRSNTGFEGALMRCLRKGFKDRSRACANLFKGDEKCLALNEPGTTVPSEQIFIPISTSTKPLTVLPKDKEVLDTWLVGKLMLSGGVLAKPMPPKFRTLIEALGEKGPDILTNGAKYCGALSQCADNCLGCFSGLMVNNYGSRFDFYPNGMQGCQYFVPDPVKLIFSGIGNYKTPEEERVRVFAAALPKKV